MDVGVWLCLKDWKPPPTLKNYLRSRPFLHGFHWIRPVNLHKYSWFWICTITWASEQGPAQSTSLENHISLSTWKSSSRYGGNPKGSTPRLQQVVAFQAEMVGFVWCRDESPDLTQQQALLKEGGRVGAPLASWVDRIFLSPNLSRPASVFIS